MNRENAEKFVDKMIDLQVAIISNANGSHETYIDQTREELIQLCSGGGGNGELKLSECRKCKKPIYWMKTRKGKNIAVEPDTVSAGDTVYDKGRHGCHWESCVPD